VLPRDSAADAGVAGLANVEVIRAPTAGPDTPRALWFQHATMPRLLRAARIDVHVAVLRAAAARSGRAAVVIVHDGLVAPLPETKTRRFRAYMDAVVRGRFRRARFRRHGRRVGAPRDPRVRPDVDRARSASSVGRGSAARRRRRRGVPRPYPPRRVDFDGARTCRRSSAAWRRLRERPPARAVLVGDPARAADLRRRVSAADDGGRLITPGYVTSSASARSTPARISSSCRASTGIRASGGRGVRGRCGGRVLEHVEPSEVAGERRPVRSARRRDVARGIATRFVPGPNAARGSRAADQAAALTWERTAETTSTSLGLFDRPE